MHHNPDIFFVDYQPEDFQDLMDFWNSLGLGGVHRGDNASIIDRCNAAGGFLLLLKKADGKIAGSSWVTSDGRRSYLHHFGIAENLQGSGQAQLLMEKSMERIKAIGLQVKLEVHRSNNKAVSLYKKYGFSNLGDYDVFINRNI